MSDNSKKGTSKIFRWGILFGLLFVVVYGFIWMTTDEKKTANVKGATEAGAAIVGQLEDGVTTDNKLTQEMSQKQVNDKAAEAEKNNKSNVSLPLLNKEPLEERNITKAENEELARLRKALEDERNRNRQQPQQQQAVTPENPYASLILGATTQYLSGLRTPPPGELYLSQSILEGEKERTAAAKTERARTLSAPVEKGKVSERIKDDLPSVITRAEMGELGKLPAGTILYGMVEVGANSDQAGTPVMAQVISGPYTGMKFIGEFVRQEEQLVVKFSRSVQKGQTYPVNAFAIDPKTSRPGVRTDVDTHFWSKWGFRIASRFIEGLGNVISESGQTIYETQGGSVLTTNEQLKWKDKMLAAGATVGKDISDHLDKDFDRPPTVTLDMGQEIGILLLE